MGRFIKIVLSLLSIPLFVLGGIFIIAPCIYFIDVLTYDWIGVGWEHEPLLPPTQLIEVGFLFGIPLLLIGALLVYLGRWRGNYS